MIKEKIESKKGFYVGDICYPLNEDTYKLWGDMNFKSGKVKAGNYEFAVADTYSGDGYYYGDNNVAYPVDAGNIGIIPLELIEKIPKPGNFFGEWDIYHISGTALFYAEEGRFLITLPNGMEIRIDTQEEDWED